MIKTEREARIAYRDMLNECYTVEGLLKENPYWVKKKSYPVPASMILANDPTMYRCGFNDWIDGMVTDRQAVSKGVDWSAY